MVFYITKPRLDRQHRANYIKSTKVGEETKKHTIKVCDGCDAPNTIYVETDGNLGSNYKPTGRTSLSPIFGCYMTKVNFFSQCNQCGKVFCEKCIGYDAPMWNENDEHIDNIILCKECNRNRTPLMQEFIDLIDNNLVLEWESTENGKILEEKYKEFRSTFVRVRANTPRW